MTQTTLEAVRVFNQGQDGAENRSTEPKSKGEIAHADTKSRRPHHLQCPLREQKRLRLRKRGHQGGTEGCPWRLLCPLLSIAVAIPRRRVNRANLATPPRERGGYLLKLQ